MVSMLSKLMFVSLKRASMTDEVPLIPKVSLRLPDKNGLRKFPRLRKLSLNVC